MISWMTRMSFLDSAADLETDHLVQLVDDGTKMIGLMFYGVDDDGIHTVPTEKMWFEYEVSFAAYVVAAEAELVSRGVDSHNHLAIASMISEIRQTDDAPFEMPPWIEDADVLRSHRSNLVRRWPKAYGKSWSGTPANMPYVWPFTDGNGGYALFLSKHDKELLASGERVLPTSIKKRIENL